MSEEAQKPRAGILTMKEAHEYVKAEANAGLPEDPDKLTPEQKREYLKWLVHRDAVFEQMQKKVDAQMRTDKMAVAHRGVVQIISHRNDMKTLYLREIGSPTGHLRSWTRSHVDARGMGVWKAVMLWLWWRVPGAGDKYTKRAKLWPVCHSIKRLGVGHFEAERKHINHMECNWRGLAWYALTGRDPNDVE